MHGRSPAGRTSSVRGGGLGCPAAAAPHAPQVVLWAWERPCDLTAMDPREVGVAPLVVTVRLDADGLALVPRQQPLRFPPAAPLMAVARIETERCARRASTSISRRKPRAPSRTRRSSRGRCDPGRFRRSGFGTGVYRELLAALRQRVPARVPLSITALASWCFGDRWLEGLPIEEAVPMLFRMATDGAQVRRRLEAGEDSPNRSAA